jgi:hypothetical protein
MSGLVVLIAALGPILTACGSSAGTATARLTRLSPSCVPPEFSERGLLGPRRPLPKALSTPLDAAILSSFAIFRRPPLQSDEPPELNLATGGLGHELYKAYKLSSYYPTYARQLTRLPDGQRYLVIPAYGRPEAVVPAHCLVGGVRERRALVEEQHRRLVEPVDCIIEVGGSENAPPQGCEPFAAVGEAGRVFQPDLYKEPIVELAPDGVASVRIDYRETPAIVVAVSENAFLFTPPPPTPRVEAELKRLKRRMEPVIVTTDPATAQRPTAQRRRITLQWDKTVDETEPTRIEWLDSAGRLVRALSPPAAESNSATSVGNLDAPLEGSITLKRSRSSPRDRQSASERRDMAGPVHGHR